MKGFPQELSMNKMRLGFLVVLVAAAFATLNSYGQDQTLAAAAGDRYVISAKAGGVNYIEGPVSVSRTSGRSGYLTKGDSLQIGERISTANGSKAEILLNPGSYLRLGDNTRFEFISTSLDDLQLQLDSGSAILEVFATEDFTVSVKTPRSTYVLVESGIYRVDVSASGDQLEVWKGAARIAGLKDLIKAGRTATTRTDAHTVVAKFDRDDKDPLDVWSKVRSRELAKIASKLDRDQTRTALMRSYLGRRWDVYSSFGLWVFNPLFGGYCFLPFGYGWNSPYGYGLGHYLGWYNLPPIVWYPPSNLPGGNTGPSSPTTRGRQGNQGFPTSATRTEAGVTRTRDHGVPPFVRMQDSMGRGRGFGDRRGSSFDPNSGSPSYTPSFPASSPAPLPTRSDSAPLSGRAPTPVRQP